MDQNSQLRMLQDKFFRENEILRERVATMEAENAAYQDRIEEYKQMLVEKDQRLRERDQRIRELQDTIVRKDKEIETLKKPIAKTSTRKSNGQKKK